MDKCILFYTCNTHRLDIELACRRQLLKAGLPIVAVSLDKPIDFGDVRIVVEGVRSPEMMHRQVLTGLEASKADIMYLCESDVLYHPSHFDFTPAWEDIFYYNTNIWKVRYPDGHAVWTDDLQQVSGCCAYRKLLTKFYRLRLAEIVKDGFNRHYEPGPKTGPYQTENWQSEICNIDIRHENTITRSKWSIDEYRNKRYAKGWQESDSVPGWYEPGKFVELLAKTI